MLSENDCRNVLEANLDGLCKSFYAFSVNPRKCEELRTTAQSYIYFAHAIDLIDYSEFTGIRDWIQSWGKEDLARFAPLSVLRRLSKEATDG